MMPLAADVRATARERTRTLPGDELIPMSPGALTHAITIARPRREVWPWLVQMGAGRAGWYSYDFIDNGRRPSASTIRPELQHVSVGSVMPWLPGATDGFIVLDLEPEEYLLLGVIPEHGGAPLMTWVFVLEDAGAGATRLIVRARVGPGYQPPLHLPRWSAGLLMPAVHFLMERKQLLGIRRRVETSA